MRTVFLFLISFVFIFAENKNTYYIERGSIIAVNSHDRVYFHKDDLNPKQIQLDIDVKIIEEQDSCFIKGSLNIGDGDTVLLKNISFTCIDNKGELFNSANIEGMLVNKNKKELFKAEFLKDDDGSIDILDMYEHPEHYYNENGTRKEFVKGPFPAYKIERFTELLFVVVSDFYIKKD